MPKPRYIMIGGFLGAGKTTAILRLAEHLRSQNLTVGLITNDQSVGLVDTAMLGAHGFAVEEITGGCFCCRFNSLVEAAEALSKQAHPDVFIAEPVGSCTDLKASVSYPLRRMYGSAYSIAPLSVLLDPLRALRILGLESGKAFSPKVAYVYQKQLEEAELIVINKIDLLTPQRLDLLRQSLSERYPSSRALEVSIREGTGLDAWFRLMEQGELGHDPSMQVDYQIYAEGEALLGWFNISMAVSATEPIDGNALLVGLATSIQRLFQGDRFGEIAHLKMTLAPSMGIDIAVCNLVRSDHEVEMSHRLDGPIDAGELTLNLRAEADPEAMQHAVAEVIEQQKLSMPGIHFRVVHQEHFRPGIPAPTHRYANA